MENETEKTILPYLNVLEVETIDKSNVTKVIVIDKDDEVKVMDGSQLGSSNYQDLQFKPEINGVELNGNIPSKELGIPSIEDVDNQITEKLADYPTKEEVTTGLNGKQDTLVSGTNIKTINSQSLVGSGNIDTQDIPTLYISRYKNVTDTAGFDKVRNAILTNKPFLIYFNLEEGNINLLCESALTMSGGTTITTVFHREFGQNPSDHKVYTVTITKNELPDVTEMVHNYINYGTGTQPQIYTITVLTQEEYNALPTKDSNTQYLIVE